MKICANFVGRNSEIIIKTNEKETMIVVLITEYEEASLPSAAGWNGAHPKTCFFNLMYQSTIALHC